MPDETRIDVAETPKSLPAPDVPAARSWRTVAFTLLTALNAPLALLAGIILHLQFGRELTLLPASFDAIEDAFGQDFEQPVRVAVLVLAELAVYALAWAISFRYAARRRPTLRLLLLHFEFAVFAAMAGVAAMDLPLDFLTILGLIVWLPGWPAAMWGVEIGLARLLTGLAKSLLASGHPEAGTRALFLAILLKPEQIEHRRTLGVARFEAGDVLGTIDVLQPMLGDIDDDRRLLEVLEECYRTEREWGRALDVEKRLIALNPHESTVRLRAAATLEKLGRRDEAIELLREREKSAKPEYLERLVALLCDAGRPDEAAETARRLEQTETGGVDRAAQGYQRILEAHPDHAPTLEALGDLLARHNRPDEACEVWERIVERDPQRHDIRTRLVRQYQESERIAAAEPHLQALLDAGQESADIALLYGDVLVRRDEHDKALLHFQYAVERFPEDYRFPYFLARIGLDTQALEDARFWCDEAERLAPGEHERRRVQSLRRKVEDSHTNREIQVLQDRVRREPDNVDLQLQLAGELARHGEPENAVAQYDDILERHPDMRARVVERLEAIAAEHEAPFRLLDYLGDLRVQDRDWDGVLALANRMAEMSMQGDRVIAEKCRQILKHAPEHAPALRRLGQALIAREDWAEALETYERLAAVSGDGDESILRATFRAHVGLEHTDQALALGEELAEKAPHDISVRLTLVRLYRAGERYDDALRHLRAAQGIDYYHPDVVRLMREVSAERRTHRLEQLDGVLEKDPDNAAAQLEAGTLHYEMGQAKKAITFFQRAAQDESVRNLARARQAQALAHLRMFDLADETLAEVEIDERQDEEQRLLKAILFDVAERIESEGENARALDIYKRIFRVDASFRNVVDKVEMLGQ